MGFIFDGLDAEDYDRTYTDKQLVRRIGGYLARQRSRISLAAGAITLIAAIDTAVPVFISRSLDQFQRDPAGTNLLLVAGGLVLLTSTSWTLNAVRQTLSSRAVGDVVLQMREDAADAIIRRDMSFYDAFASGKIVSRVTSDTQSFAQVMTLTLELISRFAFIVLLISYLFTVSVRLTIILMILAPLVVLVSLVFRTIARRFITLSRRMNANVSAHIQETVSGIGVAKTFRQEPAIYREFLGVNSQSRSVNLRTRYTFSSIFPLLNILAGFGIAALVYFGGLGLRDGSLTAGQWYLFIQGLSLFWFPLTSIASFWSQFQIGLAAGERVFALIDAESRVVQTDDVKLPHIRGEVQFADVDFSYESGVRGQGSGVREQIEEGVEPASALFQAPDRSAPWVLHAFNLHIQPGETLALVGHTGSGKSSIAKLIARFYEFQNGQITIDGVDIRRLDLADYRARLGVVTQTPFLFDGTVQENIRYGRPDASDDEVLEAAQHVGGGDWLVSLPNGMQSEVGERGNSLSMGQRQLVALARVLLQNPSIFILDEATASIDPLTETLIQEGLDAILEGRTSIVIAHRLSTIRNADRIIVLRQGAIIEEGSHDTLLRRGGHYAELYNTYFRHQSLEYIEQAGQERASSLTTFGNGDVRTIA